MEYTNVEICDEEGFAMNWQYLQYFKAVTQEGDLLRATEQLGVSQSELLKAIQELRDELGVPLLEVDGQKVRLNKYGRAFRNCVFFASNEITKGVDIIRNMAKMDSHTVSLSSIFTMGANFVPPLIKSFQVQYPEVRLAYYQKSTKNILRDLLDGNIEFGFCGEFPRVGEYAALDSEIVLLEELRLAVPEDHWLAERESVRFEEIKDEIFVGYTDNTGIIHTLQEELARAGYNLTELKQAYQVAEDNTVVAMVRAGLGIAFVANNPVIYTEGVRLIPVTEPHLARKLYMVWKRNSYMSPAAKSFKYHVLASIDRIR